MTRKYWVIYDNLGTILEVYNESDFDTGEDAIENYASCLFSELMEEKDLPREWKNEAEK